MGKFFNGNVKNSKSTIIKIAIVGVCAVLIIVILIAINNGKNPKKPSLSLYNKISIDVNDELPNVKDYFEVFENYDENNVKITYPDNFDTSYVGTYEVTVTIDGKDYTTYLEIIDDEAPELVTKDYEIVQGNKYYVEDFIESCKDNSNEPCTVKYYDNSKDQDGNTIDYSNYTEPGNYLIKIVASDENGNTTEPISANLKILDKGGNSTTTDPIECKYGDLTIDTNIYNHPIGVIVGDEQNNCALNRDLWDNKEVQKPVEDLYKKDNEKLKNDFSKIYESKFPNGAQTHIYQDFKAVYNKTNTGLVGYSLYIKLYAYPANENIVLSNLSAEELQKYLIAEYYIKSDGSREYIQNPYNIN